MFLIGLLVVSLVVFIGYVVLWFIGDYRTYRWMQDLEKRLPQSIEDYERDLEADYLNRD